MGAVSTMGWVQGGCWMLLLDAGVAVLFGTRAFAGDLPLL